MANIKTAISIDTLLFEQRHSSANELNISRSRMSALVAYEFIQHQKNHYYVEALNIVPTT